MHMNYTKQNFKNGSILTAEQLNHMEDGIEAAMKNSGTGTGGTGGLPSGTAPNMYLTTNADGVTGWEEKLAYTTKTGGDTVEWDGNTDGLVAVEYPHDGKTYYLICGEIPDLSTGKISYALKSVSHYEDGSVGYGSGSADEEALEDYLGNKDYYDLYEFAIVPEEAVNVPQQLGDETIVFPAKGIYLAKNIGEGYYSFTSKLTIKGFDGFPGVKAIDPKFLPESVKGGSAATVFNRDYIIDDYDTGEGHWELKCNKTYIQCLSERDNFIFNAVCAAEGWLERGYHPATCYNNSEDGLAYTFGDPTRAENWVKITYHDDETLTYELPHVGD